MDDAGSAKSHPPFGRKAVAGIKDKQAHRRIVTQDQFLHAQGGNQIGMVMLDKSPVQSSPLELKQRMIAFPVSPVSCWRFLVIGSHARGPLQFVHRFGAADRFRETANQLGCLTNNPSFLNIEKKKVTLFEKTGDCSETPPIIYDEGQNYGKY